MGATGKVGRRLRRFCPACGMLPPIDMGRRATQQKLISLTGSFIISSSREVVAGVSGFSARRVLDCDLFPAVAFINEKL